MKKDIIRVGDWVKVVNPQEFIRCGYPLSFQDEKTEVYEKYSKKVEEFLHNEIGLGVKLFGDLKSLTEVDAAVDKICGAIAYETLKRKGFGGRSRQIYTKENKNILGKEGCVSRIKFHKTGEYYSPSGGGEYDYESGGLRNEKTHKILEVNVFFDTVFKIEAVNVEKVPPIAPVDKPVCWLKESIKTARKIRYAHL